MRDPEAIQGMEVPIIVQLGDRQMTVREVTDLAPGSIIELPKRVEEELCLYVSNKAIGQGTAVKIGENFGIQITFIGDLKARLAAATSFRLGEPGPTSLPEPGEFEPDSEEAMLTGQL